jgi:hypothetical protein
MDFRVAVVLDRTGRASQTAVLAGNAQSRVAGHRLLQLIEAEVEVFADRVRRIMDRDRKTQ